MNVQSFTVWSHLTKVLRLPGLTMRCTCNCEAEKDTFSTFFTSERSRCVTLLGCGHLGDSEFKDCTVVDCTEPRYKRAEAPRSQKDVTRAALMQKKALFLLLFTNERSRCVTWLGCGHLGDSEFKECTVLYRTEPPYESAEAPRSQKVVTLATPKQKKALFLVSYKERSRCVTLLGCGHLGDSEFKECTVI